MFKNNFFAGHLRATASIFLQTDPLQMFMVLNTPWNTLERRRVSTGMHLHEAFSHPNFVESNEKKSLKIGLKLLAISSLLKFLRQKRILIVK